MPLLVYRLVSSSIVVLMAASVYAQRDRDTYNPGNQSFEVSGQVNVADTNRPAEGIPVRLERFSGGITDQITTDSRGRFRFPNLQRGYYRVIINAPGFGPAQQDADLTLLFKAYLVFMLAKSDSTGATGLGASIDVIDARVPRTARDEFVRGREALAKKRESDAIIHFQKAILFYPEFFEADLLLATAFMDLRDWPKAENALMSALQIKPDNPTALLALGEVYWREKRYDEAEKILLEGLKLDDKNWHGHFTLGRLYWDKGDLMKAGPDIGRTLQLKPDFAEAHLLAGNILLRLNQPERAQREYEEYLRLAPKGEYATEARTLIQKLKAADNKR
jgi:tetratricopeptide (TPR) repeat protein